MSNLDLLIKNRKYEIIVGDYRTGDGVLINDRQITFDISKTTSNKNKTNSAAIEIYNLPDDVIKTLEGEYQAAVFSAGYTDLGVRRLFAGQITFCTTRKQGPDRVTQIRMGSGYTELNHKVLSELVPAGKTLAEVGNILAKSIGASRGVFNGTNMNNQILYGYPLTGTPKEMLDEFSAKYGLDWQLDDDVLYLHQRDRGNNENFKEAYVISKYTGLVDNAYRVDGDIRRSKKDKAKKQGVQWTMLLNGDLAAGDIVKLEDTYITGWYKIVDLRFTGDYRGNPWYTEVRAEAIEKVVTK